MTPDSLRAFFRGGMFVTVVSLVLVFTVQRDSAEFVVSVCSLGVGLILTGLVALVAWLGKR